MNPPSLRYGQAHPAGELTDFRSRLLKLFGQLQGKRVKIITSDPKAVSEVLIASEVKGSFIESLIATPAWHPVISTESVDGDLWKGLSDHFHQLTQGIDWRNRLTSLNQKYLNRLHSVLEKEPTKEIQARDISCLTLNILFELVFQAELSPQDESLFYQASLEWRKEIAVKGRGNPQIKRKFWDRLQELILQNPNPQWGCPMHRTPSGFTSAIAQPFILSPQINMSDIMVACFHFLRTQKRGGVSYIEIAQEWARSRDDARILGILLESIRLKHPFPILEREVGAGKKIQGITLEETTQYFILMDQFDQDPNWNPERWISSQNKNSYAHFPFGAGKRMCLGKPIALEILKDMLYSFLLDFSPDRIQPEKGHLYSGRNHDHHASPREILYQLKVFSQVLIQSFWLGRRTPSRKQRLS